MGEKEFPPLPELLSPAARPEVSGEELQDAVFLPEGLGEFSPQGLPGRPHGGALLGPPVKEVGGLVCALKGQKALGRNPRDGKGG